MPVLHISRCHVSSPFCFCRCDSPELGLQWRETTVSQVWPWNQGIFVFFFLSLHKQDYIKLPGKACAILVQSNCQQKIIKVFRCNLVSAVKEMHQPTAYYYHIVQFCFVLFNLFYVLICLFLNTWNQLSFRFSADTLAWRLNVSALVHLVMP